MKPYDHYKLGCAKWIGLAVLVVLGLILLFASVGSTGTSVMSTTTKCQIQIENHSETAKIYYWVHSVNPKDAEGNPLRDYLGRIVYDMQIMGGELPAGETVTSSYGYRAGEYYLVWTESAGGREDKRTDFTIEPGLYRVAIIVYSSDH